MGEFYCVIPTEDRQGGTEESLSFLLSLEKESDYSISVGMTKRIETFWIRLILGQARCSDSF